MTVVVKGMWIRSGSRRPYYIRQGRVNNTSYATQAPPCSVNILGYFRNNLDQPNRFRPHSRVVRKH